mmetsp:Transcript_19521/g.36411  ORF Transcript_19521/g.36411 Transcript_19521/m.36411 type:complete len:304 (+) Transcript_19521:97-1008(+)|eukprot:CAMPEP_0178748740 /NCGR_PEP_ID=MMETSP0744-20121128/9039_1 /TAXON_ID=913974 /ORGANISM="Nitzschia punctata, Strain CCMP561" /LENGTH=303 /DNA_ID=CAMNT_0020402109 /DNA_START=38 /DNA_END=949 /DNA_ORIENTATION=+
MDISGRLEALKLSPVESSERQEEAIYSFANFFNKGSAGRAIFTDQIVPFLSLDDLITGSKSSRKMNAMCHTYTVGEVLALHSMDGVSRGHKMELGKLVASFADRKYCSSARHRRFIRSERREDAFWARLYHPSVMPDIRLAMTAYFNRHGIEFDAAMDDFDWNANKDETLPVLVEATYGDWMRGTIDVTIIIRYLLMKQGNARLILQPPPNGPRYWYNWLFSDPCDGVTKILRITLQPACSTTTSSIPSSANNQDTTAAADNDDTVEYYCAISNEDGTRTLHFCEDDRIDIKLRALAPGKEDG